MATPVNSARPRAERTRIVIFADLDMGYLLDLVSRYRMVTKKSLYTEIWEAGIRTHLGIEPEDIEGARPLPRGTAAPEDIQKLVEALVAR